MEKRGRTHLCPDGGVVHPFGRIGSRTQCKRHEHRLGRQRMHVEEVGEEAAVGVPRLGKAIIVRACRPPNGGKQEGDLDDVAETKLSDAICRGWRECRAECDSGARVGALEHPEGDRDDHVISVVRAVVRSRQHDSRAAVRDGRDALAVRDRDGPSGGRHGGHLQGARAVIYPDRAALQRLVHLLVTLCPHELSA